MKTKPNNVTIGDKFKYRHATAIVIDITENTSMHTGEVISYHCYAKCITGLATNIFEVPFSTVAINKINI